MDLVPVMAPALGIICVAVVIILRERQPRDVILDLTDVPCVRLSETDQPRRPSVAPVAPVSGDLVLAGGASLGARLHHVAATQERQTAEQRVNEEPKPRVVIHRRRRTPLVAGRHAD